jgi:hypothetical protein
MRSRVPVYSWAFRVTSRYGARVSIITKLKSLTDMISHGQQRNAERDAPSSELRYISGPGIDGLGNLNECTRWRRYVPRLSRLCVVPMQFLAHFSGINHHSGKNRNRNMESAVLSMRSAVVLPSSHRGAHRRCPNGDHVHRIYPSILRFFGRMSNILC